MSTYALKRSYVLLSARYSSPDGGAVRWKAARLFCTTAPMFENTWFQLVLPLHRGYDLGYDYDLKTKLLDSPGQEMTAYLEVRISPGR